MVNDIAVQEFVKAIKEEPQDTNRTYNATVSKVDSEGVVWVNIHGSDKETPTSSTSAEVKKGDTVTVNWRNNRLYIAGNYSNPSAGVTTVNRVEGVANNAQSTANIAYVAATNAVEDAERAASAATSAESSASQAAISASNAETSAGQAATAASNAQASAGTAATAATNAESSASTAATAATNAQTSAGQAAASAQQAATDAASAKASAYNANEYATRALGNLSTVQSVAETLTWITQHGTMSKTTDTDLDPTHVYFVRDNNGDYVVGSYHYSIVVEPQKSALSTYYVLSIDESLNNYVATHLSLTNDGLYVMADDSDWKVLVASDGMYIKSPNDTIANQSTAGGNIIRATDGTVIAHFGYGRTTLNSSSPYYSLGERIDVENDYDEYDSTKYYHVSHIVGVGTSRYVCIKDTPNPAGAFDNTYWESIFRFKGKYSVAEGNALANGEYSHAEGRGMAKGICSHAEGGSDTLDSNGNYIKKPMALGNYSHAENRGAIALGSASHAEGDYTYAEGNYSHAEGNVTYAIGNGSHAEGMASYAIGNYSHAQNTRTEAGYASQTVIGKYNDNQANNAFEIGNGTSNIERSNALTVDWQGNVEIAGKLDVGENYNVKLRAVTQTLSGVSPVQFEAERFGKFIYMSYKIGAVSLSASSFTAILSLYSDIRPKYETIVPANITDSNYATVGTGLIRFETGGWVYLVAPKSLSQTSGLYVMFTALYLI